MSPMTVSNAFNRPDQLSAALRERILEHARERGYAGPDPLARGLRRGRAGAIGLISDTRLSYAFDDPAASAVMAGVCAAAEDEQLGLLLVAHGGPTSAVVDGIVVYSVSAARPAGCARRGPRAPDRRHRPAHRHLAAHDRHRRRAGRRRRRPPPDRPRAHALRGRGLRSRQRRPHRPGRPRTAPQLPLRRLPRPPRGLRRRARGSRLAGRPGARMRRQRPRGGKGCGGAAAGRPRAPDRDPRHQRRARARRARRRRGRRPLGPGRAVRRRLRRRTGRGRRRPHHRPPGPPREGPRGGRAPARAPSRRAGRAARTARAPARRPRDDAPRRPRDRPALDLLGIPTRLALRWRQCTTVRPANSKQRGRGGGSWDGPLQLWPGAARRRGRSWRVSL